MGTEFDQFKISYFKRLGVTEFCFLIFWIFSFHWLSALIFKKTFVWKCWHFIITSLLVRKKVCKMKNWIESSVECLPSPSQVMSEYQYFASSNSLNHWMLSINNIHVLSPPFPPSPLFPPTWRSNPSPQQMDRQEKIFWRPEEELKQWLLHWSGDERNDLQNISIMRKDSAGWVMLLLMARHRNLNTANREVKMKYFDFIRIMQKLANSNWL